MRLVCLLASLALHAAIFVVALQGSDLASPKALRPVLEMELVTADHLTRKTTAPPPAEPPKPPAQDQPRAEPEPTADKTGSGTQPDLAPMKASQTPATPPTSSATSPTAEPTDSRPRATASEDTAGPVPGRKTSQSPAGPAPQSPSADTSGSAGIPVRNEHGDRLKHGAESRTLQGLAGKEFQAKDYLGHYQTFGHHEVTIIDGRDTWGRLILYDSESGLLRTLKPFAKHIYTYGPAFLEDTPVQGSVTFLPDDKGISRFIWLPQEGPAEFPNRIEAPQTELTVNYGQTSFPVHVFNMDRKTPEPLILVAMRTQERSQALAHLLASQGLQVAAVAQENWRNGPELPGEMHQARHLLQALQTVRHTASETSSHVCCWTEPSLCPALFRAIPISQDVTRLLVQVDPQAQCPHSCSAGSHLSLPVAWMVADEPSSSCAQRVRPEIEAHQDHITLLPWKTDATTPRRIQAAIEWLTQGPSPQNASP